MVSGHQLEMGQALQALLEKVDAEAETRGIDRLEASIVLNNEECVFIAKPNGTDFSGPVYHKTIATSLAGVICPS